MLGEGPVWDVARRCLWFVDIKREQLLRFDPASGVVDRWAAPAAIGWVLPADDGTLIAGIRGGLHVFVPRTGEFHLVHEVERDAPGNRLNDATCDRHGGIWFGSMDDGEQSGTGRIYRFAGGQLVESGLAPTCITNGPALSPDGRTLYHTDTLGRRIFASTLDDAHRPAATRLFAAIEDGAGFPDGPVVDAEGCLWTGLFGGWAARRYAADGRLLQEVRFPVANVTKLAFGGNDHRTVYATTARKGLSATALAEQPEAGDLFSFEAPAPGMPVPLARAAVPMRRAQ